MTKADLIRNFAHQAALLTDGISVGVAEYIGTGGTSAKEVPSESDPRPVWNH